MKKDFSVSKETKFTDTPAEAFISKADELMKVQDSGADQEPAGKGITIAKYAPTKRERKTARLQLLVKQSFKARLQKYCNEHDYSMNDLIESVMSEYLNTQK